MNMYSKKEEIKHNGKTLSLEFYEHPSSGVNARSDGFGVELWEDGSGMDSLLHYAADFLNKQNALDTFDHVKNNVANFID